MRKIIFNSVLFLLCQGITSVTAQVIPAPPEIKPSSYLVMDYDSGKILVSENIDERLEPASLTKIMTVYVIGKELAQGNIHLDDMVMVSEKAWRMEGSRMFIEVNTSVSVNDLLNGIIIQSGNDASVAMAEHVAGSEEVFAQMMNAEAADLGLSGTHFMNSTGLPHPEHYTTARDLAILVKNLIRKYPEQYKMHSIREFEYNGISQPNRNRMLWRDETVDGVKTGHTLSAGYCLVASAKRDDMRLISVIMGADSDEARTKDTQSILNYAFRFFETHKLYGADEVIATERVWKGAAETVDLGLSGDLYLTVPRGSYKRLEASVSLDKMIVAPVSAGETLGTLRISLGDEVFEQKPLVALGNVAEGSLFNRLKDEIKMFFE